LRGACHANQINLVKKLYDEYLEMRRDNYEGGEYGLLCHVTDIPIMSYLIEKGVNPQDALVEACSGGHMDMIKFLFDNYPVLPYDTGEDDDFDPLWVACKEGCYYVAKYLLEKGATNLMGALSIAYHEGHYEIAVLFDVTISKKEEDEVEPTPKKSKVK